MNDPIDWKIVLIDDEEDIRAILSITIKDAGYKVMTAGDGEAGIRLCEEASPQIVITDIRMPKMNGLEVLSILKKRFPDIEVIVATAFGEMDLAIEALRLDASDFITKPINDEALHLALDRAKNRYTTRKHLADYTMLLEKEHAKTSHELIKSFSNQRNLIESSMDGILGCDDNEVVVTFNKGMEQMLGFSRSEALHKMTLAQLFVPDELTRLKSAFTGKRFGGKNRLYLYETIVLGKKGRNIPVQVSAYILFDQGKENGAVFFFKDLRETRKLERDVADQARILHQDKMMSLGRLAASVVHEINNPLSGILNYLRLMSRKLKRGPLNEADRKKFTEHLSLVENETGRCSKIISSLLTFSRKSTPEFGQVKIDELINRCIILSRHKLELSNIDINTSIAPEIPTIFGDFNQLQQCVINLIFNAIDAMPKGGTLVIEGSVDKPKGFVVLTVKDTGKGISKDDLPHIFDPFFTTKEEGYGVGLGLSTIYGILERHKVSVHVDSAPGKGTSFSIRFPMISPI